MRNVSWAERVAAVLFILMISFFFIKSWRYDYNFDLWQKQNFIDINGSMAKILKMNGYYSDLGMYITDDNYIVSAYPKTSTDYEYQQVMALKNSLDKAGINLVYVNKPVKYTDDEWFTEQFGTETYGNANATLLMERLSNEGVFVIDLRDNILEDHMNVREMFYRTDHHWTTRSGLWAAKQIAEGLNENCGYSIDTSIYDESNFEMITRESCWLGEQGRKVSQAYVGLDDYTEIKPKNETHYLFATADGNEAGAFEDFIDETIYDLNANVYDSPSWHYSYMQRECHNEDIAYGKVLLVGDSYDQTTEPFLSLGISEMDYVVLRDVDEQFNLEKYILDNDFDTVILCYAQFMIGAHDDEDSANYNMFTFVK